MVYTTIHSRWCLGQQQCICCCPSLSDTATYNFRVINRKLKQLVGQQNDFSLLLLLLLFLLNSETTNYRVGMWIAAISVCAKKHINSFQFSQFECEFCYARHTQQLPTVN